jgi:hypothetical protein
MSISYRPGNTGADFLTDRSFVKVIGGPVGGGKSTVCLMDLLCRAEGQAPSPLGVRRTRFIILRNTIAQLKSTVKPLIDQWLVEMMDGTLGTWKVSDNIFTFGFQLDDGTRVESELWLMAADTPDDVRRLLSVECSAAWVEESREVPEEIFSGLQGRVNRYPNRAQGGVTYPGVIASTNAPRLGSFWHKVITEPPEGWSIFMQPPALLDDGSLNKDAENLENLAEDYYENLVSGKSEEWIDVYLRNRFGAGDYGHPVYKASFKKSFHVAKTNLDGIFGTLSPLVIGMDNGLTAAAALTQRDSRGRINAIDECYVPKGTTMGVERFLDTLLIPKLRSRWSRFKPENILFVLDPACFQRSQVNEKTIADAVRSRGYTAIPAGSQKIDQRIGSVERLMSQQVDGMGLLLISPCCTYLIEGMEWGYRFKKNSAELSEPIPEKNHHANLQDAFQYAAMHHTGITVNTVGTPQRRETKRISSAGWT